MMPKKKAPKGKKVSLKAAKKAIRTTLEGKRRLTLSNMGITVFPKCLFRVKNVDELDLSRNMIQKLPENIDKLRSVNWLDLHSNKLESVPEAIGNMVGLIHLNLANNSLTPGGLPRSLGSLTNLKYLNLGLNKLDSLPSTLEHLTNLEELGLFDNLLKQEPELVTTLPSLDKVNLKRNPFTYKTGVDETVKKKMYEQKMAAMIEKTFLKAHAEALKKKKAGVDTLDVLKNKKKRKYPGLMTPNSVAKVNQDEWRLREPAGYHQTCATIY